MNDASLQSRTETSFAKFFLSVTHCWDWSELRPSCSFFQEVYRFPANSHGNLWNILVAHSVCFPSLCSHYLVQNAALLRSKLYCLKWTVSKMRLHWIILEFYIDFYFEYEFVVFVFCFFLFFFLSTAIQSTVKKSYFQRFLGGTIITRRSI